MDQLFMKEALRQARKALGRTSPNPVVGAVIVKDGNILARGYHHRAGLPHAEAEAISKLNGKAHGCTLYVTLEPCNHHGKTPPCTEAILKSGIKRVVVGMKDPNPLVSGGGLEFLKEKGIEVKSGVLESECILLNEIFIKFVTKGRPFVICKSAMTLDGWTATATGHSKWITNSKSREFVHRLRDRVDAVLVGVGTIIADDPNLTTRLKNGKGKDPLRIVADTHLRTPVNAKVITQDSDSDTLLVTGMDAASRYQSRYNKPNVSILSCPAPDGKIDLSALMDILAEMSVTSLLVEGGASICGSMLRERLIDKFYIFKAPKILGGGDGIPMASGPGPLKMDQCMGLTDISFRRFGDDILIKGYPG
ncbi:MAG: riboflavin biosynthesis protein RibD [Desulfobacteraceae bacterium 4484_190.1]|nr:MAG: riboflavin biosynthesis protein RibD [Desulfobacteraceae bacterium 4484_190.1]